MSEYDERRKSRIRLVGGCMAGITVFGTLALTAPFVFTKSPLPFMATPGHKVYRALRQIRHTRGLFVDMGSGDGEAVYQALRAGYRQAVGIELNFTLYALSQLRRKLFWTAEEQSRSKFLYQNMFEYNLQKADTVFVFGVSPLMQPLSEKMDRECRVGTHVLSYRFQLPLDKRPNPGEGNLLKASVVYDEEEMKVYQIRET